MKLKEKIGLPQIHIYNKIWICFVVGVTLLNCSQNGDINNNYKLNTTNMRDYLKDEQKKIENLMNSFPKPIRKIPPVPTASQLSAIYAVSYEVVDENVICVIYIYENQKKHDAAKEFFTNNSKVNIKKSLLSSNGRLFFWGFQKTDDPKSRYVLNDLASTFSGEE